MGDYEKERQASRKQTSFSFLRKKFFQE